MARVRVVALCAAVIAAGCRERAGRPPPAAATAADAGAAAWTHAQAMARWRELAPTARTWPMTIPADQARPLARALLRDGHAPCAAFDVRSECGHHAEDWLPVPPDAGLADPCFRRTLWPWALAQLAPDDVRALAPLLATLVTAPPRDDELAAAAFAVAVDDAMRLTLLRVALATDDERRPADADPDWDPDEDDRDRAEAWSERLTTDAARLAAYRDLGLTTPLAQVDPVGHRRELVAIVADPDATPAARGAALERLGDATGDDVTAALRVAVAASSCELAAAAADALAARGDRGYLPAPPASHDPAAHLHALCMLSSSLTDDADARWRRWLPARVELETRSETYIDEMPGIAVGDPDRTRVRAAEVELPSELHDDDWQCDHRSCARLGYPVDVRIVFAARGPTLVIKRIERLWYAGDDC